MKETRNDFHDKTFAIITYGCQMNEHDSERLRGMLISLGLQEGPSKTADVILYNTCCVREHAEARVFGNIGALCKRKAENPGLFIAVCGCMMQQEGAANALLKRFPFVDMVFGTHSLHVFPQNFIKAWNERKPLLDVREDAEIIEGLPVKRLDKDHAYVTIMYGCNNFCSYCVVPYVRGRERSRTSSAIEAEVLELIDSGVKEITLLGQNVNSYGQGTDMDFAALLERLASLNNAPLYKFMTSHPKDLSERLIDVLAGGAPIANHVHLPVQSGSDRILSLMNRGYTSAQYLRLLDKLRAKVKDVTISTDVIVGFPSETEQDFEDTLSLVREARFASAYTFMFSPRKGTKAALMPEQIGGEEKKRRLLKLNEEIGGKESAKGERGHGQ